MEDVEGKGFIYWWKETWVLAKGMERETSASPTLQGRKSNQRSKKTYVVEESGGGVDPYHVEELGVKNHQWQH